MKTYSKQKYVGIVSGVMFNLNKAQIQNFLTSIWRKRFTKIGQKFSFQIKLWNETNAKKNF